MNIQEYLKENPRVFGAFLIGGAMIWGAFLVNNFGVSPERSPSTSVAIVTELPQRQFLPVVDADNNGIEDWREEFVLNEPILVPAGIEDIIIDYEEPDTVTGQMSVRFLESILRSKISGGIGPTPDVTIARTVDQIATTINSEPLYNRSQITTTVTTPDSIRTYANTMGSILLNNNVPNYESELTIINRALQNEDESELQRLLPLTSMYRALRDQSLQVPVPDTFIKEHLDLINTYHASYKSLSDTQLAFEDPVLSLMRIKRYQDDADGLGNALTNMFNALIPYANLFTPDDPAVAFVVFAPNYQ
jgi:hypothetical protein